MEKFHWLGEVSIQDVTMCRIKIIFIETENLLYVGPFIAPLIVIIDYACMYPIVTV